MSTSAARAAHGFGLMSIQETAAIDPIFWVHHANIDRLWEVWLNRDETNNANPTDSNWLGGPTDRAVRLYDANGNDRPSNPQDVLSTPTLGYACLTISPIPYPANSDGSSSFMRSRRRSQPLHRSWRLKWRRVPTPNGSIPTVVQ